MADIREEAAEDELSIPFPRISHSQLIIYTEWVDFDGDPYSWDLGHNRMYR